MKSFPFLWLARTSNTCQKCANSSTKCLNLTQQTSLKPAFTRIMKKILLMFINSFNTVTRKRFCIIYSCLDGELMLFTPVTLMVVPFRVFLRWRTDSRGAGTHTSSSFCRDCIRPSVRIKPVQYFFHLAQCGIILVYDQKSLKYFLKFIWFGLYFKHDLPLKRCDIGNILK